MYREMIMGLLENLPETTLRRIYFFIRGFALENKKVTAGEN